MIEGTPFRMMINTCWHKPQTQGFCQLCPNSKLSMLQGGDSESPPLEVWIAHIKDAVAYRADNQ